MNRFYAKITPFLAETGMDVGFGICGVLEAFSVLPDLDKPVKEGKNQGASTEGTNMDSTTVPGSLWLMCMEL